MHVWTRGTDPVLSTLLLLRGSCSLFVKLLCVLLDLRLNLLVMGAFVGNTTWWHYTSGIGTFEHDVYSHFFRFCCVEGWLPEMPLLLD